MYSMMRVCWKPARQTCAPLALLLCLVVAAPGFGAADTKPDTKTDAIFDPGTYLHPHYLMQFTDSPGWVHRPRPGDPMTHELVDPRSGIHALMWMTSTEQSALRYLTKMSRMMDLTLENKPFPFRIDGRDSWVLDVPGVVEGKSVRTLLAVVPSGHSPVNPRENLLYIFQFYCPAEEAAELQPVLHGFLHGIRVTD